MNSPPLTTHHSPLTEALCHRLTYAAILLLIILAYSPFLGNYFVQDDFTWLEVAVWSSRDITRIFTLHIAHFFMPLGHLVFLIEYRLFGLDPFGYSLVNLALHALNCVLLFHLARRITQNDSVGLIAAILFACNSSHFHGVVWISALPRLILTALMLAALLAFDSYLRTRHRTWYALSLLFCVGAMLSKEQCVVLAPLLLLHQALFDPSREGTSWRRYRCLVPHLALFAAYLAVEVPLQQHSRLLTEGRYAPGLDLRAVLSALTALGGLFVPRELVPPAIMPPLLLLIAVAVLVTVALAARSPQFPARPAIYGLIWAFVGLIPGSFFKQAQIVAHRLTYIPAVGH
ncbi:MAG: hypothetical protein FJ272_15435, partial [Planctomycetes bacterium]|nr:hypothetical protein [Planctomycetota bacterium]